ncbi:hypothetical protein Dimus_007198 [Dionaea muscipula]
MGNRGRPRKRAGSGRGVTERGDPASAAVLGSKREEELRELGDGDILGMNPSGSEEMKLVDEGKIDAMECPGSMERASASARGATSRWGDEVGPSEAPIAASAVAGQTDALEEWGGNEMGQCPALDDEELSDGWVLCLVLGLALFAALVPVCRWKGEFLSCLRLRFVQVVGLVCSFHWNIVCIDLRVRIFCQLGLWRAETQSVWGIGEHMYIWRS